MENRNRRRKSRDLLGTRLPHPLSVFCLALLVLERPFRLCVNKESTRQKESSSAQKSQSTRNQRSFRLCVNKESIWEGDYGGGVRGGRNLAHAGQPHKGLDLGDLKNKHSIQSNQSRSNDRANICKSEICTQLLEVDMPGYSTYCMRSESQQPACTEPFASSYFAETYCARHLNPILCQSTQLQSWAGNEVKV